MNKPNPDFFDRPPHYRHFNFIIDSKNRDKNKYVESNDFCIKLPIPNQKNVRDFKICHMTIPKTESKIYIPQNRNKGTKTSGFEYDLSNNILNFNEGITIDNSNNLFNMSFETKNIKFYIPKTLTEVIPLSITKANGQLKMKTCNSHYFKEHQHVRLIGYPYSDACNDGTTFNPNGIYEVVQIIDNYNICLSPPQETCVEPGLPDAFLPEIDSCDKPFLMIDPHIDNHKYAQFVEDYGTAMCGNCPGVFSVEYDDDEGKFVVSYKSENGIIHTNKNDNLTFVKNKDIQAYLPPGNYDEEELASVIEFALNQPTIVDGVNDTFNFTSYTMENTIENFTITLSPGTYTPETLIMEIVNLMNDATQKDIYTGNYDIEKNVFCIMTSDASVFDLNLSEYPEFAKLIGFLQIDHKNLSIYCSQCKVYFPAYATANSKCTKIRSKGIYTVNYDKSKNKYSILKSGNIGAQILTVQKISLGTSKIETVGPHGFEVGDIIIVYVDQNEDRFSSDIYVVTDICGPTMFHLNMSFCDDGDDPVQIDNAFVTTITTPFIINDHQNCGDYSLSNVLGLKMVDHPEQPYYCSTKVCFEWNPSYLLVQIPELFPKIEAVFEHCGPTQEFVARLDCDQDDNVYKLTDCCFDSCNEFISKTLNIDQLTIRIVKPNGKLYDTMGCDFSLYCSMVVEN